jgi:hypothetical protein
MLMSRGVFRNAAVRSSRDDVMSDDDNGAGVRAEAPMASDITRG